MDKVLSVLITGVFLFCISGYAYAQSTEPSIPVQIRQIEDQRHSMPTLRQIEERGRSGARFPGERIPPLTVKEKKAIEALKTPKPEDISSYSRLLALKGTGMVRLLPGAACASKYIVRADLPCTNILPNVATHVFRKSGFTADIAFQNGELVADGFFAHSIMTSLGNIPLDDLTESTKGMQYISSYSPASDVENAKRQYSEIVKGITADGFIYKNRITPVPGSTYAIRIVAFRNGNNVRKRRAWYRANIPLARYQAGYVISKQIENEVRIDLTVAFRVIKKDEEGGITLVWKELSRRESPKLIFADGIRFTDFK